MGGGQIFLVDILEFHAILRRKKFLAIFLAKIFLSPIKFACRQTVLGAFEVFFLSKTAGKFKLRFFQFAQKSRLLVEVDQLKVTDFFLVFR